ncbi:hypothetical protein AB1Y20_023651 [Prymnesium parvum]|uniref:Major facilitator superfamily (MFS) profile domain-containing protein n=1 Tax=Prymnesium parvum TaxID=97485 RepID=A0AB34JEZ2_PRYPA|mmetsp:Transcript_1032/g.2410  ORF Transcript_1032/g.2410 Transcript_1032/m.2410 type:complete len:498 (-) Transcript_1032:402-1895(-)
MCMSRSLSEQRLAKQQQTPANGQATPSAVQPTPLQEQNSSDAPPKAQEDEPEEDENALFDEGDAQEGVSQLRMREFALIYIAYMGFLIARKNYGFWLPSVLSELGKGKREAGTLGSTFEMTYGAASLFNGILIDMASPKHLLVGGLLLSGLVNVCIGATTSLPIMVVLWGANGVIQSFGWPSITNVFLAWFPDPASRGAWYSLLSTCQNVGAALVPLLVSSSMAQWGWKAALYSPAAASCIVAGTLGALLYGSPEAARNSGDEMRPSQSRNSLSKMLGEQVVMNPALWLMAVNYFGVSMLRTCLSDWSNVFLQEEKSLSLPVAARCLFLMELGGFAGSLVAGSVSDKLFQGRRGPVVCICTFMLAPTLLVLLQIESAIIVQGCYLLLGFSAFPVHVLLGLFSREVVPAGVSSSAGGFVKCIAQIGGAFAGYPLGALQQSAGWRGVISVLALVAVLSALSALPLWRTTAQNRIRARNGTVSDFKTMNKKSKEAKGKLA